MSARFTTFAICVGQKHVDVWRGHTRVRTVLAYLQSTSDPPILNNNGHDKEGVQRVCHPVLLT